MQISPIHSTTSCQVTTKNSKQSFKGAGMGMAAEATKVVAEVGADTVVVGLGPVMKAAVEATKSLDSMIVNQSEWRRSKDLDYYSKMCDRMWFA